MNDIWLPAGFEHPERVELATGHHLRPIREADVAIDYPAVMGSRDRLWTIFGGPWGWPPTTMTYEQDQADLARHEREIRDHESFNYAVLDADESHLLGCVYIDPAERVGADADICWWVVDDEVGLALDAALAVFVPQWIADAWPFAAPRFIGRDLGWEQWLALPGQTGS
jgi:RimJ/RimL family protein N-acetyltransferase